MKARLLMSTALIALIVLCSGASVKNITPFAAYGSLSMEWFAPEGGTRYKSDARFAFFYAEGSWQVEIDIESPSEQSGIHKSCKKVPEGIRYYTSFPRAYGTNTVAAEDAPLTASIAKPVPFPPPEDASLFFCWLSLCPSPDLPITQNGEIRGFLPLELMMDSRNKDSYSVTYLAPENLFLSQLTITNNGLLFRLGADPIPYPMPFKDGFLESTYDVLETTNFQGFSFPLRTALKHWAIRPGAKRRDDLYEASIQRLQMRAIEPLSGVTDFSKRVSTPGLLLALDQRPAGLPKATTMDHFITNDAWASITNARLATLAAVYREMGKNERVGKNMPYLVAFILLTVAVPLVVAFVMRKYKQRISH